MMNMDSTAEQRRAFGVALDRALMAAGRTRAWLGAEVAREVGKPSPVTQSAVSQWISGAIDPARSYVFASEKILGLRPGTLSRLLGYLPADARQVRTVVEAIDADPALSEQTRMVLRAAYLAAIQQ